MADAREIILGALGRVSGRASRGHVVILCPWHEEKTPSCHIYPDGHINCFGCGANGSAAWVLRTMRYGALPDAEGYAKAYADLEGTGTRAAPLPRVERWRAAVTREDPPPSGAALEVMTRAALLYRATLVDTTSVTARGYAERRGVMDRSPVGYCDGVTGLARLLSDDQRAVAYSLGLIDASGGDRLAGRLVIPDYGERGLVRYLTGRAIPGLVPGEIARTRKYLNLKVPRVLYGEFSPLCLRSSYVLIVEGQMCQLALARVGIPAVALGGTTLPRGATRFFDGKVVIPCLDAPRDDAERRARYDALTRIDEELRYVAKEIGDPIDLSPTGCKDPDEYIARYGCFPIDR